MRVSDLETPVPVIDLDRVEANLKKMQDYCDAHGLKLRPHIKTHKIPAFAHRQIELGAGGITCQKLGEAEVMARAGMDDILISYPMVGVGKAQRLGEVARLARLRVAVDSSEALNTVADAARIGGATIGVLVEFDSGAKRTGVVSVAEALTLAQRVVQLPGLRFDGLMTYPSTAATAVFVAEARKKFAEAGLDIPVVSGGGTPNAWTAHEIPGLTEVRVGTYIYQDRSTVAMGAATLDECALLVHATVVSHPTPDRAIIDAGSKSLSSDRAPPEAGEGYGLVLDYPGAIVERLNEEHGILDLSRCAKKPAIGERIRILPNHVCVVSNLHDEVVVSRNGEVVDRLRVAARGMTR
ncbi:MAG: D-TA family PLP-dependent enzyme [Alphaproteobacteria bacterium]|jgi:D-serine deaminase-like pyridoxal phosphate-dependent protein